MSTIPVTKDTAPPAMLKLARAWLYDNDLPAEWEEAVALEFDAALTDRQAEILTTDKEGRPYTMAVADWMRESRCHCQFCQPGSPDDQCPVHGFEAWKRQR